MGILIPEVLISKVLVLRVLILRVLVIVLVVKLFVSVILVPLSAQKCIAIFSNLRNERHQIRDSTRERLMIIIYLFFMYILGTLCRLIFG